MVERITNPHRPVQLTHGLYRIPDGHIVPNPPRPTPAPEPEPAAPTRYEWRVFWTTVAVVALGVLIGVLR